MQTTSLQTIVGGCHRARVARGVRQVPSDDVAVRMGENLRRERRRAGMTQEELADQAALHRTAIGLLEQGHRMARADTLLQLAGALSISPAAFFRGVYWTPAPRSAGSFAFERAKRRTAEPDEG
jgi:transcriptional regulator with XRE-family HTH domain